MENIMWIGLAVVGVLVLLGIWMLVAIAGQKKRGQQVELAREELVRRLQVRADCVPEIAQLVKAYADNENEVFLQADKVCNDLNTLELASQIEASSGELDNCIENLFRASRGYPQLESSRDFLELKTKTADTETGIQNAKRHYNGAVREYNRKRTSFPVILVSKSKGFAPKQEIELQASNMSTAMPKIDFG